jgi:hypothetical protein
MNLLRLSQEKCDIPKNQKYSSFTVAPLLFVFRGNNKVMWKACSPSAFWRIKMIYSVKNFPHPFFSPQTLSEC